RGMQAVLNVISNRAAHPGWWGHDVAGVCQAHAQFSCWDATDPNLAKLLTVTNAEPQFREALVLAGCLVADHLADLTGGADHYYDHRGPVPSWAKGRAYRCVIGHHTFYRLGLRGDGK
ncbi:cell wall hydrolase, partial [Acetobacter malorum]|uniref:cell wall hydrolase n=1 Tax=Acetobacter malorum TaxID=178901 RepID=UPI00248E3653